MRHEKQYKDILEVVQLPSKSLTLKWQCARQASFMFILIADKNKVVRLVSPKCFTSCFWLKLCTELAVHKLHSLYRVRHKSINTPLSHERLVGGLQDGGRGTHVTHFVQLYPQPLFTASQVRTTCRSWDEGVLTDVCLTGALNDLCLTL